MGRIRGSCRMSKQKLTACLLVWAKTLRTVARMYNSDIK